MPTAMETLRDQRQALLDKLSKTQDRHGLTLEEILFALQQEIEAEPSTWNPLSLIAERLTLIGNGLSDVRRQLGAIAATRSGSPELSPPRIDPPALAEITSMLQTILDRLPAKTPAARSTGQVLTPAECPRWIWVLPIASCLPMIALCLFLWAQINDMKATASNQQQWLQAIYQALASR